MSASNNSHWIPTARLVLLLIASWCAMLMTHEVGHILGGWISGATLKDYDLRPWRLPYSIHDPNPHPLVTLWSGPFFGILAPLAVAVSVRRVSTWFVFDFCLLANGVYLVLGLLRADRYLDTTMLLENGMHPLAILGLSLPAVVIGYFRFRRDCLALLTNPQANVKDYHERT